MNDKAPHSDIINQLPVMKIGKIVLLPMLCAFVILMITVVVALLAGSEDKATGSVFDYQNAEQIEADGYTRSLDGSYSIQKIEAFSYIGAAKIKVSSDAVKAICFTAVLSESETLDAAFAKKTAENYVRAFSTEYGFSEIETPIGVQYCDEETFKSCPADMYDAMAGGYLLLEYSYRDAGGVLWIAQVYSPAENIIKGSLTKQVDESDYADFQPQINMEKGEDNPK